MPETSYTSTAAGWVLILGAASYIYFARNGRKKKSQQKDNPKRADQTENIKTEPKARRLKKPSSTHSTSRSRSPLPTVSSPLPPITNSPPEKEDLSWASALAEKRRGTLLNLSSTKRTEAKNKTVKLSNANKIAAELSGDTSTTGGDADDDQSQYSVEPVENHKPAAVFGDIYDMLDTPAKSGPSILKITQTENHVPEKVREHKAPKQDESKKQRQARRKAEEKKAVAKENEEFRKALEERQRRTAREARGEPAKNGVAAAAASKAWKDNNGTENSVSNSGLNGINGTSAGLAVLLDTADSSEKEADQTDSSDWAEQSMMGEQEQIRLLTENDEASWKTVSKKDKKKRYNGDDGENVDGGAVQQVSGSE